MEYLEFVSDLHVQFVTHFGEICGTDLHVQFVTHFGKICGDAILCAVRDTF